ncbi:MAG: tripartite tricarboxylate transporter substrate-binding protein [Ottowia sp.]|uniref:Bug family tripartite tricarboxylate transporter substrate binding protein n=1 Tax=Ottowia sp. TaxID=1898956 RepID=UPI003C78B2DA
MKRRECLTMALLAGLPVSSSFAQATSDKPVRLLVGSAPGGGTDAIARMIADALAPMLKQSVVVDNKPGAGGMLASEQLTRSAPDGYTLLVAQNGHTTNPAFYKKLPYDTLKDFTPVASLAISPLVLVASSESGVKDVKGLIEFGRRNPKAMSFAVGDSSTRMAVEQISSALHLSAASAIYKGTGPAVADVAGGHVPFSVTTIASVLPFRSTGKLNFVAVAAGQRSSFLPDVPTLAEQGLPGISAQGWWGVLGPANMPQPVVDRLNGEIGKILATPEAKRRMLGLSAEPWIQTPHDFDAFIRKEVPEIVGLARKAGIQPE